MQIRNAAAKIFQSTLPARGATRAAAARAWNNDISIHAPRTGSDDAVSASKTSILVFQSTLPARGATPCERDGEAAAAISIHAPRTGSDRPKMQSGCARQVISIHAPRTGSDSEWQARRVAQTISIHAPRTGSDRFVHFNFIRTFDISIHAPRTGSDWLRKKTCEPSTAFQSTLPARGATTRRLTKSNVYPHFNPRSPHGERPPCCSCSRPRAISIHAPRTGSDGSFCQSCHVIFVFQSTLPARGATTLLSRC